MSDPAEVGVDRVLAVQRVVQRAGRREPRDEHVVRRAPVTGDVDLPGRLDGHVRPKVAPPKPYVVARCPETCVDAVRGSPAIRRRPGWSSRQARPCCRVVLRSLRRRRPAEVHVDDEQAAAGERWRRRAIGLQAQHERVGAGGRPEVVPVSHEPPSRILPFASSATLFTAMSRSILLMPIRRCRPERRRVQGAAGGESGDGAEVVTRGRRAAGHEDLAVGCRTTALAVSVRVR